MTRSPIGAVRSHPEVRALLHQAVAEAIALAGGHGIGLPGDVLERHLVLIDGMPEGMKSSMQEDLERGKPLELPWLSGAVVRLGEAVGVETPCHRFIHTALTLHAGGR